MQGKLILCATPVGNLEDMAPRAVRALSEADLIAAEDTRNSIKLLNHFGIHTPMTSYHEYNKYEKGRTLIAKMQRGGTVALITDAGTPGISDPGEELVRMAGEAGIAVTAVPGPAALILALILSGLSTRRFVFEGFLPPDKKEQREVLSDLENETRTIVLYEAPHRLVRTLEKLRDTLGERRVALCRELTKVHETVERTTLGQALEKFRTQDPRGEYVLVLEGKSRQALKEEETQAWMRISAAEHVRRYEEQGLSHKEAMRQAAKDRGVSRREVYQELHKDGGA